MAPGEGFGLGWMWLWWLLLLVGVTAMVVGILLAVRSGEGPADGDMTGRRSPARQILDERFARGEIDEDEYRIRRGVLGDH